MNTKEELANANLMLQIIKDKGYYYRTESKCVSNCGARTNILAITGNDITNINVAGDDLVRVFGNALHEYKNQQDKKQQNKKYYDKKAIEDLKKAINKEKS